MKLARKVGSTSEIWQIFIRDSSSTTGAGLAGLTNLSGSLTAYFHRDTDTTATAIALVSMTVGTFTSSGFKEIDGTNMPGFYQLCPPNTALATGAKSCVIMLKGAANMVPLPIEVDLQAQVDLNTTQPAVTFSGLTTGALSCSTITASGAVAFQSTFAVTTSTALAALSCTTLTASGAVAFQSTFAVTTSTSLAALSATTVTFSGAVAFQSTFAVTTSTALGALSCSTLTASGAVAFQSTFATTGTTTFNAFTVTNNMLVSGTSTVTGATTHTGTVTYSDGFAVNRSSSNTSAVTFTGNGTGHGFQITSGSGATGNGINISGNATSSNGISVTGNGTGSGITSTGGATGRGMYLVGGASSGVGLRVEGAGGNSNGLQVVGVGSGAGVAITAGLTGAGMTIAGGGTSGAGFTITTTSGDGISVTPTAGNALTLTANGTSKHGAVITGGTAGTSDGVKAVAGTGGVPIRGDITGNITGDVSGSVGSVSGDVGGNVVGSVDSISDPTSIWDSTSGSWSLSISSAGLFLAQIGQMGVDYGGGTLNMQINGSLSGNIGGLDTAALTQFVTIDTTETSAAAGSVAKLAQGTGGDPWTTSLPGSYSAGQAGYILGTNLDAAVSSISAGSGATPAQIWSYGTRVLTSGSVFVMTPHQVGSFELMRGGSYLNTDSNALTFTKGSEFTWPSTLYSLPWTVKLCLEPSLSTLARNSSAASLTITGTVVSATSTRFDVTKAQTTTLTVGRGQAAYTYRVLASRSGVAEVLLESGNVDIIDDLVTT